MQVDNSFRQRERAPLTFANLLLILNCEQGAQISRHQNRDRVFLAKRESSNSIIIGVPVFKERQKKSLEKQTQKSNSVFLERSLTALLMLQLYLILGQKKELDTNIFLQLYVFKTADIKQRCRRQITNSKQKAKRYRQRARQTNRHTDIMPLCTNSLPYNNVASTQTH